MSAGGPPQELAAALRAGERQALARAITLAESRRPADQAVFEELLAGLLPHGADTLRIGVTGAPGVGKSTLIEAVGGRLCASGRRVAVLAVDPSSARTGGSILGDKTRMAGLARDPRAFVRPSPSGEAAGGVAARTREAILLCEAAGFEVILVETVGTGQAETAVADMVDFVLLLLSPAAGDDLQGIKRGVMELADAVLVHKADGELAAAAGRAAQQCRLALRVLHGGEGPPVLTGSSVTGAGLEELWAAIEQRLREARTSGRLAARRCAQRGAWFETALRERLLAGFAADPAMAGALAEARAAVAAGRELPPAAARRLLARRRHAP